MEENKYKVVTVGGTFDYFHKGHRRILEEAFRLSEKVVVGVVGDRFYKNSQKARKEGLVKRQAFHQSFVERRTEVEELLKSRGYPPQASQAGGQGWSIWELEDMFGPLRQAQSYGIEAMVVTENTKGNAEEINRWRKKKGMYALDILEVEMEKAQDGEPISSTRIRNGEINREGIVYAKADLWGKLPKGMRKELREPLGEVRSKWLEARGGASLFITVGDVSTKRMIDAGARPDIVIFDLKVQRKKKYKEIGEIGLDRGRYDVVRVENPAGRISNGLWKLLSDKIGIYRDNLGDRSVAIWVEGEEDLATLPAILFAPLGSVIVYGQPPIKMKNDKGKIKKIQEGMALVEVDEEVKEKTFNLLKRFKK